MKISLFVMLSVLFPFLAQAQLEKVIHQTFEVEEASEISLDLVGDYKVELWAGNTAMTETRIQLYEASPAVLNHFLEKEKRYEVTLSMDSNLASLSSHDKERRDIRTKDGPCSEIVEVRVFLPDDFEKIGENSFKRKPEKSKE